MARMIAEVYDALRSAGADEEKARAAATAVAESDFRFAEIRTEIANFRAEFERRISAVENRMSALEGRLERVEAQLGFQRWAFGVIFALLIAILVRSFWPT